MSWQPLCTFFMTQLKVGLSYIVFSLVQYRSLLQMVKEVGQWETGYEMIMERICFNIALFYFMYEAGIHHCLPPGCTYRLPQDPSGYSFKDNSCSNCSTSVSKNG